MVSMATADQALKTVYLGAITEQMNTEVNPLLAKIKQSTEDVWGKDVKRLVQYGVNGGVGAGSEAGSLPASGGNNYQQFTSTLKNLYGTIQLSDKAIRASQNSTGAFVNLLNAEMDGLVKASSFNFGRMLFGDGSGVLATVESFSGFKIGVDNVKNLAEGMIVDIISETGDVTKGAIRIVNVDRLNMTVSAVVNGITENQTKDLYFCVQGSFNKELTGLGAIFDTTRDSLYGLNRSENSWMNPYVKTVGDVTPGNINDVTMQSVIDYLEENFGSQVDFIVCSSGVKRNYQNYLASYRSNIDVMELAGGFKAISYNGIPVVSDRFAPANTMYMLNSKEFNLHQLCDWKWLEGEDGRVIKQNPNHATYSATLVKYADLICNKPCGQAVIRNIAEV